MKKIGGFSLIELMTVVVIIGILTAISVPTFKNWQEKNDYNQTVDVLVGMLNTTRTNTQSEKQCSFTDNSLGEWMIQIGKNSAVLGCYRSDHNPVFQPKSETKYDFAHSVIDDQRVFYTLSGNSYSGFKDANVPLRIMWHKDKDAMETVSIFSQQNGSTDFTIVPVDTVALNYEYEPDITYTKPICVNRISGYPYLSKADYNISNPQTLCAE